MNISSEKAASIVLDFINALNEENFVAAGKYLREDLAFIGVLGTVNNSADYLKEMKQKKLKYEIKKVFVNETDVCLLYAINMGVATIFGSGWYQLSDDKISNIRVVFDPRPLFDHQGK